MDAVDSHRARVEAAAAGDQHAFEQLISPIRDRLWSVCLRITRESADADDAFQDCLLAIWRGLPTFRGDAQFSTWAHRIAANAALAVVRRRRDVPVDHTTYDVVDEEVGFDSRIADQDAIHKAVATLDHAFLEALVLREYGQLSYEEIAEHQGIGVQTVKSRLNRARAAVRQCLVEQA